MARLGFIGLGHMGNPMVKNLLQKGHEVIIFDVNQKAVDQLIPFGAKPAHSLQALAKNVDVIFTMLQTGEQVKQVYSGEKGIFNVLAKNHLCIDCSSIDVVSSRKLQEIANLNEIAMVDAPVSGGVAGAKAGTLTFMVGGEESNFLRAKPLLEALGQRIIYAGAAGNGQAAKICNNMILGISMIAVSEAFILAKKLGLDPKKFFDIANHASGQCWSLSQYCPMPGVLEHVPSSNQFSPGFAAAMMLKDLRLSQEAALDTNTTTPLGAQATTLYSLFVNEGHANMDFSGIIKMIAGDSISI
jgi:3-hydroxyisobutyrate dehydrogenase